MMVPITPQKAISTLTMALTKVLYVILVKSPDGSSFRPSPAAIGYLTCEKTHRSTSSAARWHCHLGAIYTASRVVARLPSVISWHGFLARGLFHARWHGSGLRRCASSLGFRTIRADTASPRTDVLGPHEGKTGR